MNNLLLTPGSKWKHMADGSIITVTHLLPSGKIGVAHVENGEVVLGSIERGLLFEQYEEQ